MVAREGARSLQAQGAQEFDFHLKVLIFLDLCVT
jgi:hypothetical protein